MTSLQIIILAIIQGITEFLPISSSGHLILLPHLTSIPDQGLAFDVALHLGSLIAVLVYFRHDIKNLITEWLSTGFTKNPSQNAILAWGIGFATIPVGLAGLLLATYIETIFRSPVIIGIGSIIFAILMYLAARYGRQLKDLNAIRMKDMLFIGLIQALALIPGASRSGVTITAGLAAGLTLKASARFSFLLSIPVILLASGYQSYKLIGTAEPMQWVELFWGALLSGIIAYITIHYFLKWIERIGLTFFVIYRIILGVILIAVFV